MDTHSRNDSANTDTPATYSQAREWLADRIAGYTIANADAADDILDNCEVREEWGVRFDGAAEHWLDDENTARKWVRTTPGGIAHLIRRYVITTPAQPVDPPATRALPHRGRP